MPSSVAELVLPHVFVSVATVDRQFSFSAAEVHTQQWISVLHLQYHEVFRVTFHKFRQWSLVEYKSVVLGRHQLQARVAVFTLGQWLEPRPAVSVEAVLRLLAPRSIKTIPTYTPSTQKISTIHLLYNVHLQCTDERCVRKGIRPQNSLQILPWASGKPKKILENAC